VEDNLIEKHYSEAVEQLLKDDYVSMELWEDKIDHIRIMIKGVEETPYENGIFIFEVKIRNNYPYSLPYVYCHTKIWHPNIDSTIPPGNLNVCFDLKNPLLVGRMDQTYDGPETKKELLNIIYALKGMIHFQKPFFDTDQTINEEAGEQYKKNPKKFNFIARKWTGKHAAIPIEDQLFLIGESHKIVKEIIDLETAKQYFDEGKHEKSVNITFFIMENAVLNLFNAKQIALESLEHRNVMYAFVQHFIQTGHISGKIYQLYNNAFGKSLVFDRRSGFGELSKSQAQNILRDGKLFVKEIQDYMKRNNLWNNEYALAERRNVTIKKMLPVVEEIKKEFNEIKEIMREKPDKKSFILVFNKIKAVKKLVEILNANFDVDGISQIINLKEITKTIKKYYNYMPHKHRAA